MNENVTTTTTPGAGGVLAAILLVMFLFYAVVAVVSIIAMVKIVKKAGYPGWYVLFGFIPLVGLLLFAFKEWPLERQARGGYGSGYAGPTPQYPYPPAPFPVSRPRRRRRRPGPRPMPPGRNARELIRSGHLCRCPAPRELCRALVSVSTTSDLYLAPLGDSGDETSGSPHDREQARIRPRYVDVVARTTGLDAAAAERAVAAIFDHHHPDGSTCVCGCHPHFSATHDDGFDCPCTWDDERRAEQRRLRTARRDSPAGVAARAYHDAERAALAAWVADQPGVTATRISSAGPEQWEGTVDGRSFLLPGAARPVVHRTGHRTERPRRRAGGRRQWPAPHRTSGADLWPRRRAASTTTWGRRPLPISTSSSVPFATT